MILDGIKSTLKKQSTICISVVFRMYKCCVYVFRVSNVLSVVLGILCRLNVLRVVRLFMYSVSFVCTHRDFENATLFIKFVPRNQMSSKHDTHLYYKIK